MAPTDFTDIWAPMQVPELKVRDGYGTGPARSRHKLSKDQISPWTNLLDEIRRHTNRYYRKPRNHGPITRSECYVVGNEIGVSGRFKKIGPGLTFGDPQAGTPLYGKSSRTVADSTVQCNKDPGTIWIVDEMKAPWTTGLNVTPKKLAKLLGQVARYMDDNETLYGFYSTYNETVFLKRTGKYTFQVSPVINHDSVSSHEFGQVSLRECFLAIAHMAGEKWRYSRRTGDSLTSGKWKVQAL
ncbi:hypothetical protein C8Q69DRAFT_498721 [Paecilomyces variotii]|uniref:Fungal-type protein kinase domain-containing protein n=1 Tax=Byssochlamys spectabilis TaxID=264951 RepID=A0A443HSV3_BYSSP|nr:hypothetical protein C8Q69DRAFT_498721 [Paecilomyces variotii]RWQ94897.1 hypothetical protein C8Q69DRAFT_498721 [Paecilomyces variotii]